MGLAALADAVTSYLASTLSPAPSLVGARYPTAPDELPAVVVSFSDVQHRLQGLGRLPAQSEAGALPVTTTVDLANPVATFPDAIVTLLSSDRKALTLPHGPLVAADGTTTAFTGADLNVTLGATTFRVVAGAPGASDVQPDPDHGVLQFGAPLPDTGTLTAAYFIGEWEVHTERYQGVLLVEAFAADAGGVDALSRSVETALLAPAGTTLAGLHQIDPTSWQAIEEAGTTRAKARGRVLGFTFDYELVEPHLGAGGGVISTISTSPSFVAEPLPAEQFDVQRKGSVP